MFRQHSLFVSKSDTFRPKTGRSKAHNSSKNKHIKEDSVKVKVNFTL